MILSLDFSLHMPSHYVGPDELVSVKLLLPIQKVIMEEQNL